MRIKLALGGKEYEATYDDVTQVTIGEIRTIKRETGMTIPELHARVLAAEGRTDDDIDLYAVLVYLLMSHSGQAVTWADVEAIPIVELAAGLSVLPDDPTATAEQPQETPVAAGG